MSFNPMLNAQNKHGYISVDEVVQLMPEYKKAMAEMSQFDSALQINYAETLKTAIKDVEEFKMLLSINGKNVSKSLVEKIGDLKK